MIISPKTKKTLLLNLPYAIIFFTFWIIHVLYPFLPYNSMCVAFAVTVIIRIIVYMNSKEQKKYRKNVEYGSARWGNADDIQPYTDPKPENNVILTETESITMNSRPLILNTQEIKMF